MRIAKRIQSKCQKFRRLEISDIINYNAHVKFNES